jgi:hypothetical protein
MGITTIILAVVVLLAVVGLGFKTFWDGLTTGFDKVVQMGGPILKDLTTEAEQFVSGESADTMKRVITN